MSPAFDPADNTPRRPWLRWRFVIGTLATGVLALAVGRIVLWSRPELVDRVWPSQDAEFEPRIFGRMGGGWRGGMGRMRLGGSDWRTAGWLPAARSEDILDDARQDDQFELPDGWQWREHELVSDATSDEASLPLRQVRGRAYALEVDFTLETGDGELAVLLPLGGGRSGTLRINAPLDGGTRCTGFAAPSDAAHSAERIAHAALAPGERHALNVVVEMGSAPSDQRVSLTATFDGQQIFYAGSPDELSAPGNQPWYYAEVLGLATSGAGCRIHRLRLSEK